MTNDVEVRGPTSKRPPIQGPMAVVGKDANLILAAETVPDTLEFCKKRGLELLQWAKPETLLELG